MVRAYNNFWLKFVIIVLFGVLFHLCKSHVLIEGDMMVGSTLGSIQKPQTESVRSKRSAVLWGTWDFGVVPYEIDTTAGFDDIEITKIKAAMRHWENFTCIIFVERNATEHEDFIRFTKSDQFCGCCSNVGKTGSGQDVIIDNYPDGSILHELGHALGFHHEHQRQDRDDYIEIKQENIGMIESDFKENIEKLSPEEVHTLNEPYDFESIMHYGQLTGSKYRFLEPFIRAMGHILYNGEKLSLADISTILPKEGKDDIVSKMGQREGLSAIDIRKTNKLYNCPWCGRTYLDQEAAFTSPQYYYKSTKRTYYLCEWRITVIDGARIRLKINDLDIFKSSDCESDYLVIRDGYWHKSPLLGRFCGTNIPKHIVSTGNRMVINYFTSQVKHRGFAANYEAFFA